MDTGSNFLSSSDVEVLKTPSIGHSFSRSISFSGNVTTGTKFMRDSAGTDHTLETTVTTLDALGRITGREMNGRLVESWSYPNESSVIHSSGQGITSTTEYDLQGRVLREYIHAPPSKTLTDMGSPNPVLPAQTNFNVTEWIRAANNVPVGSKITVTKRVVAKTSANAALPAPSGWRREWQETIDGLGRVVQSVDPLGTFRDTVYTPLSAGMTTTTSIPTGVAGSITGPIRTETQFADGRQSSTFHPSVSDRGKSATDRYWDYDAAPFIRTTKHSVIPNPTDADGYESVNLDGQNRIMQRKLPTGMDGNVLHMHTELRDYDEESRLVSRTLPGAPGGFLEIMAYAPSNGSSGLITTKTLTGGGNSANAAITNTKFVQDGGLWYEETKVFEGVNPLPASSRRRLLSGGVMTTPLGDWLITSSQTVESGGATVTETQLFFPEHSLTRTLRTVDGVVRFSITRYNGLDVLYDTAGTTYKNKLASFSPLRERLSNVDPDSGYWTTNNLTPSTGLTASLALASGTVKQSFQYRLQNDIRAGRMSSSILTSTGDLTVYYDYNARGQRTRIWGGESPSQTDYDDLGRTTFLHTWRTGSWNLSTWSPPPAPASPDTTQWTYPNYLSIQLSKIYPEAFTGQPMARRTVAYTYHPNSSLAKRTWQRLPDPMAGTGVETLYLYDDFARPGTIDYPAASATVAATPDVSFTYDPAGRVQTRTEAGQATTTYEYTPWGSPSKETVVSVNTSALPSSAVERLFDTSHRLDLLKVQVGPAAAAPDVDYGFNATGLLNTVTSEARTITYGYNSVGTAPTALTYAHGTTTLLSSARPLNSAGLASGITDTQASTLFQSLTYNYTVDRVTSVSRGHEETNWTYRYDNRGQVTSADKKFSYSGEFARGLETEYSYDMAGNRKSKNQGGNGGLYENYSMRATNYGTANALNQYSSITHPWSGGTTWLDVSGQRSTTSELIFVNTLQASYQQSTMIPYYSFRKELALTPTVNQRYADVTVTGNSVLDSGKIYLPPLTETLAYDDDGNLTSDGRWLYTWDAENRLASMVPAVVVANSARTDTKLYFTYDGLSRRVSRRRVDETYTLTGPGSYSLTFTGTYRRSFTYDAWNLVQSLDSGSSLGDLNHADTAASRLSFVWGPDIGSQTHGHTSWQKAGGVGGLLAVLGTTDVRRQFPLMDRLGNVMGYRRAASGTPAALDAIYEYDAFGREVRNTGPASDIMPFRFSTKYTDTESGLVYYGYRFYDPDRGRWANRDPIGERGGMNLYGMVRNKVVGHFDYLGREQFGPNNLPLDPTMPGPHNGYEPGGQSYPPGKDRHDYDPPPGVDPSDGLPDWHDNRNDQNHCPKREPGYDFCGPTLPGPKKDHTGQEWNPEGANTFHPGRNCYRGTGKFMGSQCCYDSNGDIDNSSPAMGTYDYEPPDGGGFMNGFSAGKAWDHYWADVFPHHFNDNYSPTPNENLY